MSINNKKKVKKIKIIQVRTNRSPAKSLAKIYDFEIMNFFLINY